MSEKGDRIDFNEQGVDDVVIHDVKVFRLERMDEDCFWIRCCTGDGRPDHGFFVKSGYGYPLDVTHEEHRS